MLDTELYEQVFRLIAFWEVTDVRRDVEFKGDPSRSPRSLPLELSGL